MVDTCYEQCDKAVTPLNNSLLMGHVVEVRHSLLYMDSPNDNIYINSLYTGPL